MGFHLMTVYCTCSSKIRQLFLVGFGYCNFPEAECCSNSCGTKPCNSRSCCITWSNKDLINVISTNLKFWYTLAEYDFRNNIVPDQKLIYVLISDSDIYPNSLYLEKYSETIHSVHICIQSEFKNVTIVNYHFFNCWTISFLLKS